MTPDDRDKADEAELLRLAEAIADGEPGEALGGADAASSPGLRHMALIAEAAEAFGDAPASSPGTDGETLFRWGQLEARRQLGQGSFGEVYAAWDPRLRREVALKLRRADAPDGARRWLDEARSLARVRHPNVLTIYGADEHDARAGIWTELVTGRDLESILQAQGPFSAREATLIGGELCAALAAVHAAGLVHGDVKTRNVMRKERGDSPGRIVLMDFGSAHSAALAITAGRGSSVGTPLAMAPEVLRGEPATPAADVYSLGVLLFRLVTGRYPVEAATLDELRGKLERRETLSLRSLRPELPRTIITAIERALDPDPRRRHADAGAFERALQDSPADAPRWGTGVALAVIVAFALLWAAQLWRSRAPAPPGLAEPRASAPLSGAAPTAPGAAVGSGPPGTPATGATLSLRADATLYRLRAGEAAPLSNGGEIEPGDRLYLDVVASERVHAYVLDEDGAGHVVVLFPCAGADARNPLASGAAHRLPGERGSRELNWLVTSAEGRETFLMVISRKPLATLEQTVAALPKAGEAAGLQYATLDDDALRHLRGVARMVRDSAPGVAAQPGRLASIARALGTRADAGDLWIRVVQVDNPRN